MLYYLYSIQLPMRDKLHFVSTTISRLRQHLFDFLEKILENVKKNNLTYYWREKKVRFKNDNNKKKRFYSIYGEKEYLFFIGSEKMTINT